MQRKLVLVGAWMAAFGLLSGTASIFVPWMRQLVVVGTGRRAQRRLEDITVLNLDRGLWYVTLLLTLVAILGAAAMGTNQGRKFAGLAGPVVSLATASLVVGLITTFDGQVSGEGRIAQVGTSAGSWLALVSLPLLGFACGLIAIGRARRHVSGSSAVAAVPD